MGIDLDKGMLIVSLVMLIVIPMAVIIFSLLVSARNDSRLLDEYLVKETLHDINK